MKKRTLTLLLGWFLFLSSNLIAQSPEGRFGLKEGDWFEIQAERNFIQTHNIPLNDPLQKQMNNETYLLNYQLQRQLPNGNQKYIIRVEHFKATKKFGGYWVGYDSYYPPYEEKKSNPEIKNQFSLEVTPNGIISRLTPLKNNGSTKVFTSIKSAYGGNYSYTYSDQVDDKFMVNIISTTLMNTDTKQNGIQHISENGVPLLIKLPDMQLFLTDATFPVPNNTIIQGKLKDQINQEIKINMLGSNSDLYFTEKQFRTNNDGSFTCPIFLNRPLHLKIQVGTKTLTTFMEPFDTLRIFTVGHQAIYLGKGYYRNTKPNGYFNSEMKKSDYFEGCAKYNTMLSNEIDQFHENLPYPDSILAIVSYCQKTTKAVNELINSYQGKASEVCIDYFQRDWNYFVASIKLDFSKRNTNSSSAFNTFSSIGYRDDYYLAVDTMPILMNPFEWNYSYQNFIQFSQTYKQLRSISHINKRIFYYFSLATLSGYPLYSQLANSINGEFRTGLTNRINSEPLFFDFLNNCADPVLTEPLKKAYETAGRLKIGNQFPINSFVLQDSSIFNLEKLKGKSICLILLDGPKSKISEYKDAISKFSQDEVEFIIARLPGSWMEGKNDSTILKMPNVTYIELADKSIKSKLLLDRNKIFMLDKWFRIVENNAEDPMTHKYYGRTSEFEKSLRKTIETKRYSKTEKSAILKTAGWSICSILITFLGGLWIYRIRVRRIKKQESAKRRIKELEIKAIRSQMNPHFIFNALNSIQSLINGNQFKEANMYLSKFAVLLRGVLNNSEKSRISLSDELQAVELYCQLEQLRFEFKFGITIDPDVNCDLIEIPGMIIQPLAENAVVHGLSGKGNLGKLDILVKRQNGNLSICVSDNGVGLPTTEITDTLSQKGFGLKLVEERINILNLDGKEAKLTIENRSNTDGTIATLIIPID